MNNFLSRGEGFTASLLIHAMIILVIAFNTGTTLNSEILDQDLEVTLVPDLNRFERFEREEVQKSEVDLSSKAQPEISPLTNPIVKSANLASKFPAKLAEKPVEKPSEKILEKSLAVKPNPPTIPPAQSTTTLQPPKPVESPESVGSVKAFGLILSARQKFNVLSQIQGCYNVASKENKIDQPAAIEIRVSINRAKILESNLEEVIDIAKYSSDKNYRSTVDNIKRAIQICSPLRNFTLENQSISEEIILKFRDTASLD